LKQIEKQMPPSDLLGLQSLENTRTELPIDSSGIPRVSLTAAEQKYLPESDSERTRCVLVQRNVTPRDKVMLLEMPSNNQKHLGPTTLGETAVIQKARFIAKTVLGPRGTDNVASSVPEKRRHAFVVAPDVGADNTLVASRRDSFRPCLEDWLNLALESILDSRNNRKIEREDVPETRAASRISLRPSLVSKDFRTLGVGTDDAQRVGKFPDARRVAEAMRVPRERREEAAEFIETAFGFDQQVEKRMAVVSETLSELRRSSARLLGVTAGRIGRGGAELLKNQLVKTFEALRHPTVMPLDQWYDAAVAVLRIAENEPRALILMGRPDLLDGLSAASVIVRMAGPNLAKDYGDELLDRFRRLVVVATRQGRRQPDPIASSVGLGFVLGRLMVELGPENADELMDGVIETVTVLEEDHLRSVPNDVSRTMAVGQRSFRFTESQTPSLPVPRFIPAKDKVDDALETTDETPKDRIPGERGIVPRENEMRVLAVGYLDVLFGLMGLSYKARRTLRRLASSRLMQQSVKNVPWLARSLRAAAHA